MTNYQMTNSRMTNDRMTECRSVEWQLTTSPVIRHSSFVLRHLPLAFVLRHSILLFEDLGDHARTHGLAAFADGEPHAVVHGDRLGELDAQPGIVAGHAHLGEIGRAAGRGRGEIS